MKQRDTTLGARCLFHNTSGVHRAARWHLLQSSDFILTQEETKLNLFRLSGVRRPGEHAGSKFHWDTHKVASFAPRRIATEKGVSTARLFPAITSEKVVTLLQTLGRSEDNQWGLSRWTSDHRWSHNTGSLRSTGRTCVSVILSHSQRTESQVIHSHMQLVPTPFFPTYIAPCHFHVLSVPQQEVNLS